MSTSFLFHAFGLRDFDYLRQSFVGGEVLFTAKPKPKMLRCPECDSYDVIPRGTFKRRQQTVLVGEKPIALLIEDPPVACRVCGCVRRIKLGIADERCSYTKGFARFVLGLARMMPLHDIAKPLGVGWDMVKDIYKRWLKRRYAQPKLKKLNYIAVDGISVRKGHSYVTLVLDLKTGAVVFVGEGKGADALTPFWERLNCSGAKIESLAMDMGPAYIAAVLENLPGVRIVFVKEVA